MLAAVTEPNLLFFQEATVYGDIWDLIFILSYQTITQFIFFSVNKSRRASVEMDQFNIKCNTEEMSDNWYFDELFIILLNFVCTLF